MATKKVFVTVGTTKFDQLVETLLQKQVLQVLSSKNFKKIIIQIGNGKEPTFESAEGVHIEFFRYKDNITQDIKDADLVISHAGAGSCLEVLEAKKPLLVVVNEDLMDNHQLELAEQLSVDGHLYHCTCKKLKETLEMMDLSKLKPLVRSTPSPFIEFLDELMGFEKIE